MRVTVKGQVTIPKDIRDHLGIGPGSEVEFVPLADGGAKIQPTGTSEGRAAREESIKQWLERVRGTIDLGGMTPDEYFEWIRGPRDDLGPR